MELKMPAQYGIIYKILDITEEHGLKADVFGASKIGFILYPDRVLQTFTIIEVIVDPDDWEDFDRVVREEFKTEPRKVSVPRKYSPSLHELELLKIMYDHYYRVPSFHLAIAAAESGPRDYFNPTRRLFALTKYLRMEKYRDTPPEYSIVAKLVIPPGVFDRTDCQEVIYGLMYIREIMPFSLSKVVKIIKNLVSREPRYKNVIYQNIKETKAHLKTRLSHLLKYEEKRKVSYLLRGLNKIQETVSNTAPNTSTQYLQQ